jgi:hypothetical protein
VPCLLLFFFAKMMFSGQQFWRMTAMAAVKEAGAQLFAAARVQVWVRLWVREQKREREREPLRALGLEGSVMLVWLRPWLGMFVPWLQRFCPS